MRDDDLLLFPWIQRDVCVCVYVCVSSWYYGYMASDTPLRMSDN